MSKNIKTNKKIDVVVKYFYPVAAGIETNILETYSVLIQKGWDITIHTSNLDYTTGEILKETDLVKGLKVKRYPIKFPSYVPDLDYTNASLICMHNFDILPQLFIMMKTYILKIKGKKNFKLVLTPHGGFNPEWRVFSKISAIVKFLYHYSLGSALINRSVDAVRAVSEWEKIEMIKKGIRKEKIIVISNGIENEAFDNIEQKASIDIKNKVKSFGNYIVQVGRIYPIKNYETTIKALKNIRKDINYVIVGPVSDRHYLESLNDLAASLGVADRLFFAGVIRGIDKFFIMKHAETMVHMAIWESFCNVIHEGMSQGLPVVAADNTALRYLVKDGVNGYLVDTFDSNNVAEKINFLLNPQNEREFSKMSRANINFSKNHSWSHTAEKMHDLYTSLL